MVVERCPCKPISALWWSRWDRILEVVWGWQRPKPLSTRPVDKPHQSIICPWPSAAHVATHTGHRFGFRRPSAFWTFNWLAGKPLAWTPHEAWAAGQIVPMGEVAMVLRAAVASSSLDPIFNDTAYPHQETTRRWRMEMNIHDGSRIRRTPSRVGALRKACHWAPDFSPDCHLASGFVDLSWLVR